MSASTLDCILDLCRRLPPANIQENLNALIDLAGDAEDPDTILSSVDQPLKLAHDKTAARSYLICDYNRDGDSHRSPWSSEYDPPLEDGMQPSPKLRKLEQAANESFDVYRDMYYEGGVSSVYLWDLDEQGAFAGVVLLQKVIDASSPSANKKIDKFGQWDAIHVFEASERGRTASYKLTSTVMLSMTRKDQETVGDFTLSGSLTRQMTQDAALDPTLPAAHVANIGRLIEDQEQKMRGAMQEVYNERTKHVVNDLRSLQGMGEAKRRMGVQQELVGLLGRKS